MAGSEAAFARLAETISKDPRVGEYFDPGHGRLMKEWIAIDVRAKALWLRLTKEALEFAAR